MKLQQHGFGRQCSELAAKLCLVVFSSATLAAPYVPPSDVTPLEKLTTRINDSTRPSGSPVAAAVVAGPSNRAMRTLLARDPKNLDLALRVAQLYMARARSESDPRFLGQAQAALGAWWSQSEPPVPVLLLRATIRQSNHDFKNSRVDLEQALNREPNNAQAWLTLATVQQVTGDMKGSAASCKKLIPLTARLISTTCLAAVDGARGDRIHLREEARFVLAIKNSPDEAVNLARDNWDVQKEPLDARILLEAAVASRQPKAARDIVSWVTTNQLQSEKLTQLVAQVRAL